MLQENFMSLYDYLGKAAGTSLGKKVSDVAKEQNQPYQFREVSNLKYKGKVLLYTKSFLDSYFNKPTTNHSDTLQDDNLPF
jgi:hypothetical protein